jgi:hypothetical protein
MVVGSEPSIEYFSTNQSKLGAEHCRVSFSIFRQRLVGQVCDIRSSLSFPHIIRVGCLSKLQYQFETAKKEHRRYRVKRATSACDSLRQVFEAHKSCTGAIYDFTIVPVRTYGISLVDE